MKALPFAIGRVNRLRRTAMNARETPDYGLDWSRGGSWSFAHGQANDLLRVFDTLWLKQGFVLYAYAYREFHGGNGRIWAVPTDSVPVESREGLSPQDERISRPSGAIPLMRAIEGDGSPWSYLSASILSREASEFGAFWHGLDWSVHTILSRPPRQADDSDVSVADRGGRRRRTRGQLEVAWSSSRDMGADLRGGGKNQEDRPAHVHNPIVREHVYRATDTYRAGSYLRKTETEVLCEGDGGFVF